MTIVNFTPLESLSGGLLIGLASTLFLLTTGRIAGISGILKGMFTSKTNDDRLVRLLFIVGLIAGGLIYNNIASAPINASAITEINPKLIIAAIFVGIGTALGNGCTSGHGICGLSRKSKRSIIATLLFMAAGFVTVFITN
ncbi:YeeE/YedE family protein [Bacteriovorax sp. Seq25_V]|uniref:YeeE/YedE family protein n=1 Tax=Bacteriovorax sp. Seq25_V TaxID=1201288 RepID=UPI00038A24A0|nr:YeeE/YedE family protein [Bacteriovorax sp. Seq25_V]EQC43887.1 sulfur transport [Bacteriovorax sp. Seq25_V]